MPEVINIPSSLYSHRPVSELRHIYATTYGSIVNHPPSIHVPILFCVCIFYGGGGEGVPPLGLTAGDQCSYSMLHRQLLQDFAHFVYAVVGVLCIVTVSSLYWTQFILIFIYILNMCQNALILRWIIFQPIPYTCTCS